MNGTIVTNNKNPSMEFHYSGFWSRIFAAITDLVLVWLIVLVLSILSGKLFGVGVNEIEDYTLHFYSVVYPILLFLYLLFLEASASQATYGKRLLKIKVVNGSGDRMSLKQSLNRSIGKYLLVIVFSPAFLLMLFNDKKQAPYDKLAKTLVINNQ